MRVHLTAQDFDPTGDVALDCLPDVTSGAVARRMNRIATLDGSVAFNDFGHSEADRTITLRWVPTDTAADALVARLVRLHRYVYVSMPGGLWLAAPESYTPGAKESVLVLLAASKESQE